MVVGRVIEIRPHPNGEKIWLADVEVGRIAPLRIVWGGVPVVQEGDLVPVAPPGSRLGPVKMRKRRYRGEVSHGMLCSLAELGWDPLVTDRVALLDFDAGLKAGDTLDAVGDDWQSLIRPS